MRIFSVDWLAALLASVGLAAVPWLFGSGYIIGVMTVALCFGMWAASWDFMSGLTGRENFGHSLFIGAGAYTAGFLNVNFGVNPWWSLLAAPCSQTGWILRSSTRCPFRVRYVRSFKSRLRQSWRFTREVWERSKAWNCWLRQAVAQLIAMTSSLYFVGTDHSRRLWSA